MIIRYFGLPGAGKTSLACKLAIDEVKKIALGVSKYKYVFTNFRVNHPYVFYITNDMIGKYNIQDALTIIDEGSEFADNRGFKSYSEEKKSYIYRHRHYTSDIDKYSNDIIIISQGCNSIDTKIREVTEKVYYIKKCKTSPHKSRVIELILTPIIPVKKGLLNGEQDKGDVAEDIPMGYMLPNWLGQLRSMTFDRRDYYQYFDTTERKELDPLPDAVFLKKI